MTLFIAVVSRVKRSNFSPDIKKAWSNPRFFIAGESVQKIEQQLKRIQLRAKAAEPVAPMARPINWVPSSRTNSADLIKTPSREYSLTLSAY
jgi:hypothetical protein